MIDYPRTNDVISQLQRASAVLFDMDGTLFDLHIQWKSHRKYMYEHYSRTYKQELPELLKFHEFFEYVEKFHGSEARIFYENYLKSQELIAIKEQRFTPLWLVTQGLDLISSYIRYDTFFGIISSNFHESVLELVSLYGLKDRFKVIIGRKDVQKVKPHPEGIIQTIHQFDLFVDRVIFIGNSSTDEEAAQRSQILYYDVLELEDLLTKPKEKDKGTNS
ncbi:MAG: HAD family hydrolase [Promethearchaeota archaeon]